MGYKQQTSRQGLDGSSGFRIRRDGHSHQTTMPSWDSETQFRVFPAPKADGGFHPLRESTEDNDFGSAVWAEAIARRIGVQEQFTYPVRIPGAAGDDPTTLTTKALLALIDEKPKELYQRGLDWHDWPKGGKGRGARLTRPQDAIFMQGATIMAKGKTLTNRSGQPAPRYPSILMGTVSLRMYFESLGNARVEGYNGPAPDSVPGSDEAARKQRDAIYAAMFQLGDWCSLEHGRIMRIYQAPPSSGAFSKPHYEIGLGNEFPLDGSPDLVRNNWVPWEDLLYYHTAEEHVQLLCRAFPPEAVDYALNGTVYSDLLPAEVKGAWAARARMATQWPGGVPQAPQPQMPPQMQGGVPQAPAPQMPPQMQGGVPQAPAPQMPPQAPGLQPMNQFPQAPAPQMQPPMQQFPQQPAPQPTPALAPQPNQVSGFDMSGGADEGPDTSLAEAGEFNNVPELQQVPQMPPQAPAPQMQQPQMQQPQMPVQNTATPPGATNVVPDNKLLGALDRLKAAQAANAGGNPAGGQVPPQQ